LKNPTGVSRTTRIRIYNPLPLISGSENRIDINWALALIFL
jgi:hypothetical protein